MSAKAEFEQLAQHTVTKAATIEATVEEYIEGLEEIISSLEASLAGAQDDLRRQEDEE